MIRNLLCAALAVQAVAGCVSINAVGDPVSLFRLNPVELEESGAAGSPPGLNLEVTGNQLFDNQRLWIYTRDNEVQAYAGARWVMPLTDLVEQVTARSLERGGAATIVERGAADARLVLSLREFQAEQHEAGNEVRVALQAQLVVVEGETHYQRFAAGGETSLTSPGQLASAFDAAYGTILAELAAWLGETLERGGAG